MFHRKRNIWQAKPKKPIDAKTWARLHKWNSAIAYQFFLDVASDYTDKASIRHFLITYPKLWSMLSVEKIDEIALDSKEWMLHLERCISKHKVEKGKSHPHPLDLSDECAAHLEFRLLCDILSGECKKTKQLEKAILTVKEHRNGKSQRSPKVANV